MHPTLVPGALFPDLRLPDQLGEARRLTEIAKSQPLVLAFVRGWWCPKELVRLRALVAMQEEIQIEYGRLAVVTTDAPPVNAALRTGLAAAFPFLSDEPRKVAAELDLLERTDRTHRPFLPYTFALDSRLRIHAVWLGYWYWGNPTPDELRLALRAITRAEQPTFDPLRVWTDGAAAPDAGLDAPVVWVREDPDGNEIWRGPHEGALPNPGAEYARSPVDGRRWLVHRHVQAGERIAIHLRKEAPPEDPVG